MTDAGGESGQHGPMSFCRARGRWVRLTFGSVSVRSRLISSCWAASLASARVRKSVSSLLWYSLAPGGVGADEDRDMRV